MHPFSLLEIKSREKRFLLWNDLLFQAKLKKKSVENFTVSTIPADGILWIQLFLGIYSCTAKFMPLSASGMQYWGSQDLRLWAAGTQGLPPRHKSWKSSQASPFPPAIIPLYQTKPWPIQGPEQKYVWVFASWTLLWTTKYCLPWLWLSAWIPSKSCIFLSHHICAHMHLCYTVLLLMQKLSPKITFLDMPKHSSFFK